VSTAPLISKHTSNPPLCLGSSSYILFQVKILSILTACLCLQRIICGNHAWMFERFQHNSEARKVHTQSTVACDFRSKPPVRVTYGSTLTDCLWLQAPCCQYCCPKGVTEQWYLDHPEDYKTHPPTFLAQMRGPIDINADLCAGKNYHETMLGTGLPLALPSC